MQAVTTIGLDIAKSVFQVHGIDAEGKLTIRRQLRRRYVLAFSRSCRHDKGNEGKYLLLPPGYSCAVPEGHIPLQADTYGGVGAL